MSDSQATGGAEAEDSDVLADLFDVMLQEILDGRSPDLASFLPNRPDLRDRIAETWALACSVAGRREPSRPVLGGYEILRELGHGGMGTVYLARHQALQREVAIKVLPHSLALSTHAKQRFLEEARALARVRNENVVHIHRIIDHEEMLAFEMEFVGGPSLRALIVELAKRPKPQAIQTLAEVLQTPVDTLGSRNTTEWFVRLGIRIARALGEVHRHGLVHRDVKPSNILLRTNGQPVLADFGLARDGDPRSNRAAFAGTPVYAAPERLRAGDVDLDARADVYSLGVTLYEALTLGPSFAGSSTDEVLRHIEEGNLSSLRTRAPNVSRDLETVIAKAMEADRRHRYATADEFADDLERLLSLQPIHARPAGPLRRGVKFVRRHQRVAMAAAAGAVVVAAVAWPLAAHARAADAAKSLAAAAMTEARSRLLSPEGLDPSWSPSPIRGSQQVLRTPAAKAAKLAALDRAIARYDDALALDANEATRVERDVVAFVRAQVDREGRVDGAERGPDPITLPALTRRVAQLPNGPVRDSAATSLPIATASPHDRFAAGLLAFLQCDHGASRQCWEPVARDNPERVFVDACLALQMADEGLTEGAYPRLFQAARAFPTATAVAFAIADAAVAIGDLELAEEWLARIPSTGEQEITTFRRERVRADLLAARGRVGEATKVYRELTLADPSSPEPLQRFAALVFAAGDAKTAERLYQEIARRWPDLAQPRTQLARLALQKHDVARYLDAARQVLALDSRRLSAGSAAQRIDVLRLGGLQALYREALAAADLRPQARRDDVHPLTIWLRRSQTAGIEQALRLVATFDRTATAIGAVELRPIVVTLQAAWGTLARLPRLTLALPWQCQAVAMLGLPLFAPIASNHLEPILLPFRRILGDRVFTFELSTVVRKPLDDWNELYGNQVLLVGDTNGDTLPDLCISAPPNITANGSGYVELRDLGDGSLLETWSAPDDETMFARSVAALGDVDGDLCADLVIGAPMATRFAPASWVALRSGRTGATIWTVEREEPAFGSAIAALGDIDGDGVRDLVAGIPPLRLGPDETGGAVVLSGRTGALLHELTTDQGDHWFGAAVADAGDGNGDGIPDILVGGNYGGAPGMVALFDGRTGAQLRAFLDEDGAGTFGACVTGLPDVDGDGLADVAIGAPALQRGNRMPGRVHVISSRTGKAIYVLAGEGPAEMFGIGLCRLADWRKRGEPALAVAARQGGPTGAGYVRVFTARDGLPLQTFASAGAFALAMVDLGDPDGDGYRNLGIVRAVPNQADLLSVSFADYVRHSESK